jgi:uncharacterized protein (DUF2225 family)
LAGRILSVFGATELRRLHSVMVYKGREMPMCSMLFQRKAVQISAVTVEAGDFEVMAAHPDPALLYDCPQARIESLRRKHAAIKASYTRTNGTAAAQQLLPLSAPASA